MSDMSQPALGGRIPIVLNLEPGTYFWCACGLSKTQPFCDGSHEGTAFQPIELIIPVAKRCALCTCKLSKNSPMCDGSHKTLPPPPEQAASLG